MEDQQQREDENNNGMSKRERREARKEEQRKATQRQLKSKRLRSALIWIGSIFVICLGVWGLVKVSGPQTEQPQLTTSQVAESEQVKGAENAPITLIEYSDFQCPACKQYAPVVRQILENYPDDIRFVYRHYPLRSIHAQAQIASEAAEAAGMQGKFFEFHDLLFDGQNEWAGSNSQAEEKFLEYAEQLSLDVQKFRDDMDSDWVRDKVNNDYSSGLQSGVSGTPSFFMNGKSIQNPRGFEPFRLLIDAELERLSVSDVEAEEGSDE